MSTGANRGRHCLPFPMLVQPHHTVECRSRIPCPKKGFACGATDHRAVGSVDRFVVTSSTVIPGLLLVVVVGMAWGFSRRLRKRSQWSAAIDIQLGLFIEHTSLGSKRARGEGNCAETWSETPIARRSWAASRAPMNGPWSGSSWRNVRLTEGAEPARAANRLAQRPASGSRLGRARTA